jgi:hypothetical protein
MTVEEKVSFLVSFCNDMRDAATAKAKDMPDNWDGHELRKYMADKFAWEVTELMRNGRSKRVKSYVNEAITRNL